MYKILSLLVFFIFPVFTQAQELTIERVRDDNYCIGTELLIDVKITGTYPADNRFTVVAYFTGSQGEIAWEYPAELRGNQLVTILRERTLATKEIFTLRVVSSNPAKVSEAGRLIWALVPPEVELFTKSGYTGDTLNSTDVIELALSSKPSAPGTITLNTGDKFDLNYFRNSKESSITYITLPKTESGTYYIVEGKNVCGKMKTGRSVAIQVNPFDFMPVNIVPRRLCEGSEFQVFLDTGKGRFNQATTFKVRFSVAHSGYFGKQPFVDVPARLIAPDRLAGIFPGGFTDSDNNLGIYVGIVTGNPSAVASNKSVRVEAKPKPGYTLSASSTDIFLGEKILIGGAPVGHPPFKLTLNTGQTFGYNFNIAPEKTTTYRVQKMESGCGVVEGDPGKSLVINVRPGLILADPDSYDLHSFCEGQTVRMAYRTNGVNADTKYNVEAFDADKKRFSFPARIVGDSIEFTIPPLEEKNPALSYGKVFRVKLVSVNPNLESRPIYVRIYERPSIALADDSQRSVPFPSAIRMDFDVLGGNPLMMEMYGGSKKTYEYNRGTIYQFIKKDTIFSVASLWNQCFKVDNPPGFPLKVTNPNSTEPSLFARLVERSYCEDDSIAVELFYNGKFDSGNKFVLEFSSNDRVFAIPVSRPGVHKFKLPDDYDLSTVNVQFSSNLPRIVSQIPGFLVGREPRKVSIWPMASRENPEKVYLRSISHVQISSRSGDRIAFSVDGVAQEADVGTNNMITIPLKLEHRKLTEVKVHRVTNACGTFETEAASYFYGIGYQIDLEKPYRELWHCVGKETEIPFNISNGTEPQGTTFTLQLFSVPGNYIDLATTNERVFRFVVPEMASGTYYIRIKSSDNIYSDTVVMGVGGNPKAAIHVNGLALTDSTVFVEYGGSYNFYTAVTGNRPIGVMLSNGVRAMIGDYGGSYNFKVTENQEFTIDKVWNSCGFGETSGKLKVMVKPVIALKRYPANSDPVICAGGEIELEYNILGGQNKGSHYIVFRLEQFNPGGVSILLDSVNTLSGRIKLKIPDYISGRNWQIKAAIPVFQSSATVYYEIYNAPDLTLSGNSTITEGESAALYVRANNSFVSGSSVGLSDGSIHRIMGYSPGVITELAVKPKSTTTYTLVSPTGQCGTAKVGGTATVTVEARKTNWLSVTKVSGGAKSNYCNGDTISVFFDQNGGQSGGYSVFFSDETGKKHGPIPAFGSASPIRVVIPASAEESQFYKVRLMSDDASVSGSSYSASVQIATYASAKVATPVVVYRPGEPVEALITLKGSTPLFYRFGDSNFSQTRNTSQLTDTIRMIPPGPQTYRILEVMNKCGTGTVEADSVFRIEVLASVERQADPESVRFGPNPTSGSLLLQFENGDERDIEIYTASGQNIFRAVAGKRFDIDLSRYPSGIYLLLITAKGKVRTYRIFKY